MHPSLEGGAEGRERAPVRCCWLIAFALVLAGGGCAGAGGESAAAQAAAQRPSPHPAAPQVSPSQESATAPPAQEQEPSQERPTEERPGCQLRLIVRVDRALDDALLAELERSSGARLDLMSVVEPRNLYVLTLSEHGLSLNEDGSSRSVEQSDCAAAAARLRSDPRVRSVDVDARRQHHRP
jgi:hypothetical protein